jgi:spore maturation protein CgeB
MDEAGLFANFFADAKIPYVSWFTDTPRMILFGRTLHVTEWSVAATWERAYTGHFEELGFEHIHFMPLATDPELFCGTAAERHQRELAFVGMSMVEQTSEAVEKHTHLPQVKDAVVRALDEGRVTRETYVLGMEAILGEEVMAALNPSEQRNVELLICYEMTRVQREDMARTLAPLGLEVRGDMYWQHILERAGATVGYFDDLAPYYRGTAVNVNNTSVQMRYAVNQRVFDCPAAGGFLLTDDQEDLGQLFDPESEVATYGSLDELKEKASWYLAHPAERKALVERAQKRIAAQHTHAHRLQALELFMKERFQ